MGFWEFMREREALLSALEDIHPEWCDAYPTSKDKIKNALSSE